MPSIRFEDCTLRQYAAFLGYETQADVVRATADSGEPVPASAVSALFRGEYAYPRARDRVSATLGITHRQLLKLLNNSADKAREETRR